MKCPYTREQLVGLEYNPREDLGLTPRPARDDDHMLAIRGVWGKSPTGGREWYWGWGKLHDDIARENGVEVLARFRHQYTFHPTVEFEDGLDIGALRALLDETPIRDDDPIYVVSAMGFRAASIGEVMRFDWW